MNEIATKYENLKEKQTKKKEETKRSTKPNKYKGGLIARVIFYWQLVGNR